MVSWLDRRDVVTAALASVRCGGNEGRRSVFENIPLTCTPGAVGAAELCLTASRALEPFVLAVLNNLWLNAAEKGHLVGQKLKTTVRHGRPHSGAVYLRPTPGVCISGVR